MLPRCRAQFAVKHGRKPPAEPARSALGGGERGAILRSVGISIMLVLSPAGVPSFAAARFAAFPAADSCSYRLRDKRKGGIMPKRPPHRSISNYGFS
jgi:hypothetical protein